MKKLRSYSKVCVLAVAVLWCVGVAAQVRDVSANEIKRVVAADTPTLVLFTSPDKGCGYCKGQAELLDEFAKKYKGKLSLTRVQWSPWRNFPDPSLLPETIYGLPTWFIFNGGKALGKPAMGLTDLRALEVWVEQTATAAPSPASPPVAHQKPEEKTTSPALTNDERATLSTMVRFHLIRAALESCGKTFPSRKDADGLKMAAWQKQNKTQLDQAAKLMFERTSKSDAAQMQEILQVELKRLSEKAPMKEASMAGCDKVASELN